MAITITGVLTKVEDRQLKDPDYLGMRKYSPNTERYLRRLNCCLTTDDGRRFFFDSPAVGMRIGNAPGVAVLTFDIEGGAADWYAENGESGVATPDRVATKDLVPLVKVGDRITVRGTVKKEMLTYTVLNRIKRV